MTARWAALGETPSLVDFIEAEDPRLPGGVSKFEGVNWQDLDGGSQHSWEVWGEMGGVFRMRSRAQPGLEAAEVEFRGRC